MKIGIYKNIIYFIIALPGLFLLVNNYPYLGIASVLMVLTLGLVFLFIRKSITQHHFEVLFILVIIYAYFILSYFISNQTLADFFSYKFLRYDGNFFFNYAPFFALAVPYFDYKKIANIFFKFIFFTFTAAAVIGIIEYSTGWFELFFGMQNKERVFLVLNSAHNATGSVYALVCIFLLVFLLIEKVKYKKVLYSLALIACLAGLLLVRSRGSYTGFIVGAIIVLWLHFRFTLKFFIILLLIFILLIPLVIFTGTFDRIQNIFNFQEGNILIRFALWDKAWDMFAKSPVFGIGFGRYNDVLYQGQWLAGEPAAGNYAGFPGLAAFYVAPYYVFGFDHAHNSYFQFLAEVGIIGLFLVLLFWVLCYRRMLIGYNSTKDDFSKKVFLSCLGGIVALFVLSLSEHYFSATTVNMCLTMAVSLAIGIYWQESAKDGKIELIQEFK